MKEYRLVHNRNEFLTTDDIKLIHDTSMKLLANVGVQFPDDEALTAFKRHGVQTDGHTV